LHASVLFQAGHDIVFAKIKWENGDLSIELRDDNKDGDVISASGKTVFTGE